MSVKKIKDTKIGAFLKNKAPDILQAVSGILPDKGGLGIVKNLISSDDNSVSSKKVT